MLAMRNKFSESAVSSLAALLAGLLLAGCVSRAGLEEPPPEVAVESPDVVATSEPVIDSPADGASSAAEEPAATVAAAEVPEAPAMRGPTYNRDDVIWIQQRLLELGYYDRSVDGSVGQATRTAVRAYQRDQDIPADGRPTAELREYMWRNGG